METPVRFSFEQSIAIIAEEDLEALAESRVHYGVSWREEGGFSAFFNIKRKIDRFIKLLGREHEVIKDKQGGLHHRHRYDVFAHIAVDLVQGGETTLDTIRDMRRYLLLTEAWMVEQGYTLPPSRDNILANQRRDANEDKVAQALNEEVPTISSKVPSKPRISGCVRGYDPELDN